MRVIHLQLSRRPLGCLLALAATAVIGVLGGCKRDGGTGAGEVRIGYFANATHAQAVLGVASGEFAAAVAPTKVTTKVFNAGPSVIEALFAGEVDIAYVGPGPALNAFARTRGEGLRVIAGSAANGVLIVARKNSGIRSMADLKGRTIATPQLGNTQDLSARHYVTAELGQADASNVAPISNAEQAGLMSQGRIDAAWSPEPWASLLASQADANVLAEEKDLWPEGRFASVVVVTTPEFLAQHPDLVEKILRVHQRWTDRLANDATQYSPQLEQALLGLTNKPLPPGVLKSALDHTTFTDDPLEHTFIKYAGWAEELGFARDPIDVTHLIDSTLRMKLRQESPALPTTRQDE